jgi:hypothetical protein
VTRQHAVVVLLVAMFVVGAGAVYGPAFAEGEARRIELAAGEQVELTCPAGQRLFTMPNNTASIAVGCAEGDGQQPQPSATAHPGHGAPTPTQPAAAGQHPAGCKPHEVFHDSQDWWAHDDEERNFGHLHTQLCFPVGERIDRPYEVTVTSVLHNNPGEFYRLMMQSFSGGLESDELMCHDSTAVACKNFSRSLRSCTATGGRLVDQGQTCR